MLACISGRRGVIGFNIATSPRPAREKVRPARSDGGRERDYIRPAGEKVPKIGVYGVLGEFCTGCADEGPVLGEFCTGSCI